MAQEMLKAALEQVHDVLWRSVGRDGQSIDWLPLMPISATGIWLGLAREGTWILGRLGGNVASFTCDEALPPSWLTLLDMDEHDFLKRLDGAAIRNGLPSEELRRMVPIDEIIVLGLKSRNAHWAERATRWLAARPLRGEQIALLREAVVSQWASQWTRQTARKLISTTE